MSVSVTLKWWFRPIIYLATLIKSASLQSFVVNNGFTIKIVK